MQSAQPWVISVTTATFQRDVLDQSRNVPVVVDFWAPWCGPCRMLGPLLEKIAKEKQGAFILAKVNTDECPDLAAAFGVQGIPAVFAVRDGRIVDHFMGALPETDLRAWIDGVLPQRDEQLVAQADSLAEQDPHRAEELYRQALAENPKSIPARLGLAKLFAGRRQFEELKTILQELSDMGVSGEEIERLRASVEFAESTSSTDEIAELQRQVASDPSNHALRLQLAKALASRQHYQEALDEALAVVQAAQGELRDDARKLMIQVFSLLGNEHPLTAEYRRRLTMALF
ncbi:MAG: thioredoxin [Thermogutta sp.]|nr:thioredoxin [Thermogutta sp.]HOP76040.1 thioredoxin [Thermogutta sp.]HPU07314.1 thioredoxin [Thermogutta sp.]HQF12931.1 thioredoxin [Thermogutta sp.]